MITINKMNYTIYCRLNNVAQEDKAFADAAFEAQREIGKVPGAD